MLSCVFCGAHDPASYKQLGRSYVLQLLQLQRAAGVEEPVLVFMWNTLHAEGGGGGGGGGEGGGGHAEGGAEEDQLFSCMCCYYWVERRRSMSVIPLPMQNLLWFMRTLLWCEGKKCDSRILQRLVETVAEPGNVFAALFDECELHGLRRIARELEDRRKRRAAGVKEEAPSVCVKRALAGFWSEQNAHCLCLPHAAVGDLLRQTACVEM